MQLTNEQRQTLDKYLPWMLAALVAWLFTRGLRRMFWTLFGIFWIMHWTGGWHAWF
ncbi:MAG TPA: hypothetical protein VFN09_10540 [Rhodanobacteraceae bacterium]|nr:hypothetical protein [Rhodanobacteraceae bacterium]